MLLKITEIVAFLTTAVFRVQQEIAVIKDVARTCPNPIQRFEDGNNDVTQQLLAAAKDMSLLYAAALDRELPLQNSGEPFLPECLILL